MLQFVTFVNYRIIRLTSPDAATGDTSMRLMSKILGTAFIGAIMLLSASHANAMLLTQPTATAVTNCVDVKSASTAANAIVWAYPCNGTVAEQWNFVGSELQMYKPTLCLSTAGGKTVATTPVVLNTCTGATDQKWVYWRQEIYLQGVSPIVCLDAIKGAQQLEINTCASDLGITSPSQQWTLH
jgi:Ricin-type beta-trefoil lectin domain